MSIQVRNPGGADERAEVVGRLKGLIDAARGQFDTRDGEGNSSDGATERLTQEVSAFAVALLGRALTGEELDAIVGE